MLRNVRPTPAWLVFLIVFTFIIVFAFIKREDFDAQRLLFGSHSIGGVNANPKAEPPVMVSSGPQSSSPPEQIINGEPGASSTYPGVSQPAAIYQPSAAPVNPVPAAKPKSKESNTAHQQQQNTDPMPTPSIIPSSSSAVAASSTPADAGPISPGIPPDVSMAPQGAGAQGKQGNVATTLTKETVATAHHTRTGAAPLTGQTRHPIDALIESANKQFTDLSNKETSGVAEAAKAYRQRRGRHPPPNFDRWVAFAEERKAVMIEDMFDQIYHDLEPFWGVPARQLHEDAAEWPYVISVRNQVATLRMQNITDSTYVPEWHKMIQLFESELPDVDLAFNPDELARIFVHWDKMGGYIKAASESKFGDLSDPANITTFFSPLEPLPGTAPPPLSSEWAEDNHSRWWLARHCCPPTSGARGIEVDEDLTTAPTFIDGHPNGTYDGFVANWTIAKSICEHPHLRNFHGSWIAPSSHHVRRSLFPLFGSSKATAVNSDILLPPPPYFLENETYVDEDRKWENMEEKVLWRGLASGGEHNSDNWKHFHRQRLVAMLNSTTVMDVEADTSKETIFYIPTNLTLWPVAALAANPSHLGTWIKDFTDVGFSHFMCYPSSETISEGDKCEYLEQDFHVLENPNMTEYYQAKFLPDVDAERYSVQFRKYLRSDSVPIKATIFSEWHDSRLIAWKHFVPMDMTYMDLWGILQYFIGYSGNLQRLPVQTAHDEEAKTIAEAGKEWSNKVLRKEDMLIYMFRVILEYARLCDESREQMGYVEDLTG